MKKSATLWVVQHDDDEFTYDYSAHETYEEAKAFAATLKALVGGNWGVDQIGPVIMPDIEVPDGHTLWRVEDGEALPQWSEIEDYGFEPDVDYLIGIVEDMERGELVIAASESDAIALSQKIEEEDE